MRRSFFIFISVVTLVSAIAIIWISVLTYKVVKTGEQLESVKSELTRSIFYDLRELDDALDLLVAKYDGKTEETDTYISEAIRQSLGRLDTSFRAGIAIYGFKYEDYTSDELGSFDFIANCLSPWYSAEINGERIEGVFRDGVITASEVKYVKLLIADISVLRAQMMLSDGVLFNSATSLDDIYPMLIEFVDKFAYAYEEGIPVRLLIKKYSAGNMRTVLPE